MIDEYNNAANIRKKILNTTKIKKNYWCPIKKKPFICLIPILFLILQNNKDKTTL